MWWKQIQTFCNKYSNSFGRVCLKFYDGTGGYLDRVDHSDICCLLSFSITVCLVAVATVLWMTLTTPGACPWWYHFDILIILIDWLMFAYIVLFSALLSRLTALACGSTWVTSFIAHFFFLEYPPKWCTYSAGRAGATWNCSRLGASPVYTIQPCSMSLHAKPHT